MADGAQTPPESTTTSTSTTGTVPDQQAQESLNDSVASLRESVDMMTEGMRSLVEYIKEFSKVTADAQKSAEGVTGEYKKTVAFVDDLKESLQDMVVNAKKFRNSLDSKTFEQTVAQFQKIKKANEDLLRSGKSNAQQQSMLERNIRRCSDAMDKLNKSSNLTGHLKDDVHLLNEMNQTLHGIVVNSEKLAANLGKVQVSKIHKASMGIGNLFGRGGGTIEKLVNHAQNGYNIKQAREAKQRDNKERFQDKKDKAIENLKKGDYDVFTGGELDLKKLSKNKAARKAMASDLVGEDGGFLDRSMAHRMLSHRMTNGEAGSLTDKVWGLAEGGGGSFMGGAAGAAEGLGAGALTKLAGPVGIGIAVATGVKDMFNAVATQNKKYEANLGKGGIFTGPEGGAEALKNVKQNLRTGGWGMNRYGITMERQMAVAQTMQESGVSISGLATKNRGMNDGIGGVAEIAFKQAREIGLTDVEGTKQTIKMMQNYKMTLSGTQTFFQTIGRDIRASGVSTSKYLELIDDVTGQFDSMGKSIGTVTSVLRMLGSTGTDTFDQLKDNVSALMGQQKTVEQRAYLFSTMTQKDKSNYAGAEENIAGSAAKQFSKALEDAINSVVPDKKDEITKGLDLTNVDDMDKALTRYKTATAGSAVGGNLLSTQLGPMLLQAQAARISANAAKSGDAVGQAFTEDGVPANAISKMVQQVQALSQGFSMGGTGSSLGKFLQHSGEFNSQTAPLVTQVGKTVGLSDPSKILQMRAGVVSITNSALDEVINGLKGESQMNPKDVENLYDHMLKQAGMDKEKGKTAEQTVKGMTPEQAEEFRSKYMGNMSSGELASLVDSTSLINQSKASDHRETGNDQASKIAGLAMSTRTSEDYLSSIKDALLGKVGGPLLDLVNFFNSSTLANKSTVAKKSINDPQNQADARLVDQVVSINKNWKDYMGPMPDKTAEQIKKGYDDSNKKINGGDTSDAALKENKQYTDAVNAMAAHLKPGTDFQSVSEVRAMRRDSGVQYDAATNSFIPYKNPVADKTAEGVEGSQGKFSNGTGWGTTINQTNNTTIGTNQTSPTVVPKPRDSGEQVRQSTTGVGTPPTQPQPHNGWNSTWSGGKQ